MIDLANMSDVDIAEIALAENAIGHLSLDTARAICRSLDATLSNLFPNLRDIFESLSDSDDDEMRAALMAPDTANALLAAGLDPDDMRWYAVVKTKSGNEMKYLVTSPEKEYLVAALQRPAGKFLRFASDCRHVILRSDAISDVLLTNATSYAPFSSRESAFEVKVMWGNGNRPERIEVDPDRSAADVCERLLAGRGEDVPAFVNMTSDDGEIRFIATDAIDALEIPVGVFMPKIYLDQRPLNVAFMGDDISDLDTIGTA